MKRLEDLKTDLLNDKYEKFYVFYGEDFGIRKHYIERLKTYFDSAVYLDSCSAVKDAISIKSLFKSKKLYIIYNDLDFAMWSEDAIKMFIDSININDYACICIYDSGNYLKSTLFEKFSEYITEFQAVQLNIAEEFVDAELNLLDTSKKELAFNCGNLYGTILIEADKIKSYADALGISHQQAYEDLMLKNQLNVKQTDFDNKDFMNAILSGNYRALAYWYQLIVEFNDYDKFFWSVPYMFNDFLIAGLLKRYGIYDGGSRAFKYGLPWGRVKEIRELNLPFEYNYYYDCACKVTEIDSGIKLGQILRQNVVDYFLVNVI